MVEFLRAAQEHRNASLLRGGLSIGLAR